MKINLHKVLLVLLVLTVQILAAQEKEISGVVTDSGGLPLPGVSVVVKNTTTGVQTDLDGKFQIKVQTGQVLSFEYIGFSTRQLVVANQKQLKIQLEDESIGLDNVVIVAYGAQKQRAVVGSIGSLGKEVFEKQQATSVLAALQGSVPGVSVVNSSGQPGESPSIRIRGIGSINASASPLIILDGVPYNGNINSISSDQIETMNVLKDAASTALYGSRGSNGVILIKTKTGRRNQEPKVSLRLSTGIADNAVKTHEVLNTPQYLQLLWLARKNNYQYVQKLSPDQAGSRASSGLISATGYNPYNVNLPIDAQGQLDPNAQLLWQTDWKDELFRNKAFRKEYSFNVSGGSDKTSYFFSANYLNQDGLVKTSKYERSTVRLNLESQVKDWFQIGANTSYSSSNQNFPRQSGSSFTSSMSWLYNIPTIYSVYERDQQGNVLFNGEGQPVYDYGNRRQLINGSRPLMAGDNAVGSLYNDQIGNARNQVNINGFAKIDLAPGLFFKTSLAYEQYNLNARNYTNAVYGQASSVNGRVSKSKDTNETLNFTNALRFDTSFGAHHLGADAIYEAYSVKRDPFAAQATGFLPDVVQIGGGTTPEGVTGFQEEERLNSILGRVSYDYANKYFIEAAYRRDGSSRFAQDVRWGDFFSIGGAWILSDEAFLRDSQFVNLLKLRASYGELGNNNTLNSNGGSSYFPYLQWFEIGNNSQLDHLGVLMNSRVDSNLTWEKTASSNIGLDFALWNNRIEGTVDYYNKASIDLLYNVPFAPSIGDASFLTNAGALRNYGLEVSLTSHNINTAHWKWDTSINFSFDRNKITELTQDSFINGLNRWEVGRSLYDFYIKEYAGVDPADGYATWYKDVKDANGIVSGRETTKVYSEATKYYNQSALPKISGGLSTFLQYKNFDLSALLNFSLGSYVYDSDYAELMGGLSSTGQGSPDLLNSWKQPGDLGDIPLLLNATNDFSSTSSRFLFKNDYLRIKAVALGYNFPVEKIGSLKIDQARVYLQGDNLLTFQSHKGIDPEQSINGVTNFRTPLQRTFTIGLNLNF